ncbi:VOC family protein [Amycolatopsis saalfeldensis]|uniref:VOC family protein n=1 Tax=Amycolatopsis saalfeldensis TaxID=394193 RepID=UPI001FE6C7BF|nr:VOC family protein [Amycolatopsis saalfeldensis]
MLRLGFPVIGVSDLPRAVAFWTSALHLVEADEWAGDNWRTLHHADGSGRALALGIRTATAFAWSISAMRPPAVDRPTLSRTRRPSRRRAR